MFFVVVCTQDELLYFLGCVNTKATVSCHKIGTNGADLINNVTKVVSVALVIGK